MSWYAGAAGLMRATRDRQEVPRNPSRHLSDFEKTVLPNASAPVGDDSDADACAERERNSSAFKPRWKKRKPTTPALQSEGQTVHLRTPLKRKNDTDAHATCAKQPRQIGHAFYRHFQGKSIDYETKDNVVVCEKWASHSPDKARRLSNYHTRKAANADGREYWNCRQCGIEKKGNGACGFIAWCDEFAERRGQDKNHSRKSNQKQQSMWETWKRIQLQHDEQSGQWSESVRAIMNCLRQQQELPLGAYDQLVAAINRAYLVPCTRAEYVTSRHANASAQVLRKGELRVPFGKQ